ncbi:MAG: hypothetical protein AAF432_12990 [Planctomycetota bacterium]
MKKKFIVVGVLFLTLVLGYVIGCAWPVMFRDAPYDDGWLSMRHAGLVTVSPAPDSVLPAPYVREYELRFGDEESEVRAHVSASYGGSYLWGVSLFAGSPSHGGSFHGSVGSEWNDLSVSFEAPDGGWYLRDMDGDAKIDFLTSPGPSPETGRYDCYVFRDGVWTRGTWLSTDRIEVNGVEFERSSTSGWVEIK